MLQDLAAIAMDEMEPRLAARLTAQENTRQVAELKQQLARKA